MTPRTDHTDDALLEDLRRVLDIVDGEAPDSTQLARAALSWRSLDSELAEMIHDSAVDGHDLLVRDTNDGHRVMSFANDEVRIDVEFSGSQLVGQIVPPTPAIIELYREGSQPADSTTADEFGAFVLTDVDPGPLSLVCRSEDGRVSIRTSWTAI